MWGASQNSPRRPASVLTSGTRGQPDVGASPSSPWTDLVTSGNFQLLGKLRLRDAECSEGVTELTVGEVGSVPGPPAPAWPEVMLRGLSRPVRPPARRSDRPNAPFTPPALPHGPRGAGPRDVTVLWSPASGLLAAGPASRFRPQDADRRLVRLHLAAALGFSAETGLSASELETRSWPGAPSQARGLSTP